MRYLWVTVSMLIVLALLVVCYALGTQQGAQKWYRGLKGYRIDLPPETDIIDFLSINLGHWKTDGTNHSTFLAVDGNKKMEFFDNYRLARLFIYNNDSWVLKKRFSFTRGQNYRAWLEVNDYEECLSLSSLDERCWIKTKPNGCYYFKEKEDFDLKEYYWKGSCNENFIEGNGIMITKSLIDGRNIEIKGMAKKGKFINKFEIRYPDEEETLIFEVEEDGNGYHITGENNNVSFEGRMNRYTDEGEGKVMFKDNKCYVQGSFVGSTMSHGSIYCNDVLVYRGDLWGGYRQGYGVSYDDDTMIVAYYENDKPQGKGFIYNNKGVIAEAIWENGKLKEETLKPALHPMSQVALSSKETHLIDYYYLLGHPIDFQDILGNTPLMSAVINNNPPIVRQLVKRGANCFIRNKEGKEALTIAWETQNYELIESLSGCDVR